MGEYFSFYTHHRPMSVVFTLSKRLQRLEGSFKGPIKHMSSWSVSNPERIQVCPSVQLCNICAKNSPFCKKLFENAQQQRPTVRLQAVHDHTTKTQKIYSLLFFLLVTHNLQQIHYINFSFYSLLDIEKSATPS